MFFFFWCLMFIDLISVAFVLTGGLTTLHCHAHGDLVDYVLMAVITQYD